MNQRRRLCIAGVSLIAVPVFAQPSAKVWRIGFLGPTAANSPVYASRVEAFRVGLRELGYVEGRNIAIEFRWAEGKAERLPALAAELAALKVDVLVTATTPGALAAKRATKTIPIVLASIGDPVSTGVVASLARPGANVTGSALFVAEETVKRLELLQDALPRTRRVAVLVNSGNPLWEAAVQRVGRAAAARKLEVHVVEVRKSGDFESAFSAIAEKRADALVLVEDSVLTANARRLAELALQHRLPSVGQLAFAEAGGLIGNGTNQIELFRRAAVFVDKILRGAKPEDLPIEQATRFELIVNLKTAKALGVALPKQFVFRAERTIE